MAEVMKVGPYEILLRFNCELGEDFGHLRGAHLVQRTYLVDDATGKIAGAVSRAGADEPKDFPPEEIQKYLGEQFATFQQQLDAAKQETATHEREKAAQAAAHAEENAAHERESTTHKARIAELEGVHARLREVLSA
jgi:hypothetical protein